MHNVLQSISEAADGADPAKKLRVAIIYSYGANEEETDGILDTSNGFTA